MPEPLKAALAAPLSFASVPAPSSVASSSNGYRAAPPRAPPSPNSPPPPLEANGAGDFIVSGQRWVRAARAKGANRGVRGWARARQREWPLDMICESQTFAYV